MVLAFDVGSVACDEEASLTTTAEVAETAEASALGCGRTVVVEVGDTGSGSAWLDAMAGWTTPSNRNAHAAKFNFSEQSMNRLPDCGQSVHDEGTRSRFRKHEEESKKAEQLEKCLFKWWSGKFGMPLKIITASQAAVCYASVDILSTQFM